MKDAEGRIALHIAAHRNKERVTKEIISMCPDCCEVVDNKGRNALHLALMTNLWPDVALVIQDNSSLRNLLNQKDNDGNTPLHHYSISARYHDRVLNSPRVDKMVFNKKNQTAYQILTSKSFPSVDRKVTKSGKILLKSKGRVLEVGHDEIKKSYPTAESEEEWEKKMIVAALVTTVTFAAGITMPGGFIGGDDHPHPGSAVLRNSVAFKAFIITNALSLMLSSSAIFIHLIIPLLPSDDDFFQKRISFLGIAFLFLLFSMAPMVLAFVTGTYAVLAHSNIAIPS
ncbi:hypothetical protein F2P56_012798, partial [Juglans regia]